MPLAPSAAVVPGQYYHIGTFLPTFTSHSYLTLAGEAVARTELKPPEYTRLANALNYTSAVIPVTKADKSQDPFDKRYKPRNDLDKRVWESCKYSLCQTTDGVNKGRLELGVMKDQDGQKMRQSGGWESLGTIC